MLLQTYGDHKAFPVTNAVNEMGLEGGGSPARRLIPVCPCKQDDGMNNHEIGASGPKALLYLELAAGISRGDDRGTCG